MTPNTYSLVSVSARPDKRSVEATFANPHKRITKLYQFFPSFYLPRTSTTPFQTLLEGIPERHQLIEHPHTYQIIASTFEDLKKIAQRLYAQTKYYPSLLETERQFLLTQNWRYFQTFDANLNPLSGAFEETKIEGLAEELHVTLKGLQAHDAEVHKQLSIRLIASHELHLPYSDAPLAVEQQLETLLHNQFFQGSHALPLETGKPTRMENWDMAQRLHAKQLVSQTPLLSHEGKCTCCTPQSLVQRNIHPGSQLHASVTQDGVYVHTHNEERSLVYHNAHAQKEKRIARAREFRLTTIPIGPLYRRETITLPLQEAIEGHQQGILHAHLSHETSYWGCTHQPFALHQLSNLLEERMRVHGQIQTMLTQPYLTRYQLAYAQHSQKDPLVTLHTLAEKTLRTWKEELPNHLLRGNTNWRSRAFTTLLASAVS